MPDIPGWGQVLQDNVTRHERELDALGANDLRLEGLIAQERVDRVNADLERERRATEKETSNRWSTRTLAVAALTLLVMFIALLQAYHGSHP